MFKYIDGESHKLAKSGFPINVPVKIDFDNSEQWTMDTFKGEIEIIVLLFLNSIL